MAEHKSRLGETAMATLAEALWGARLKGGDCG